MNTPIRWNASASRVLSALARPKWDEVRLGLTLISLGYVCLFVLVVPGLVLVRLANSGGPPDSPFGLGPDTATGLGWILASLGAFVGYLFVLAGQWRCLTNAPQGHGSKEFAYACLLSSLLAPACLGTAHFLGATENYEVFKRGLAGIVDLDLFHGAGLVQFAGVILGLLSLILFSGFLRGVARCHGNEDRVRGVACFVWFVLFLVGGTIGFFLHARSTAVQDAWSALAISWGLCFFWNLLLLVGTNRAIARALHRRPLKGAPTSGRDKGQVALQVEALLNRRDG